MVPCLISPHPLPTQTLTYSTWHLNHFPFSSSYQIRGLNLLTTMGPHWLKQTSRWLESFALAIRTAQLKEYHKPYRETRDWHMSWISPQIPQFQSKRLPPDPMGILKLNDSWPYSLLCTLQKNKYLLSSTWVSMMGVFATMGKWIQTVKFCDDSGSGFGDAPHSDQNSKVRDSILHSPFPFSLFLGHITPGSTDPIFLRPTKKLEWIYQKLLDILKE